MKKPSPVKDGECDQCGRSSSLFPFGWVPGWPLVVWSMLCWRCRTSQNVSRGGESKTHPRYGFPSYCLEHSIRGSDEGKSDRETYESYLAKENPC